MLGIIYLIFLVRASKDIVYCITRRCLEDLETETVVFITVNLIVIFLMSVADFAYRGM